MSLSPRPEECLRAETPCLEWKSEARGPQGAMQASGRRETTEAAEATAEGGEEAERCRLVLAIEEPAAAALPLATEPSISRKRERERYVY